MARSGRVVCALRVCSKLSQVRPVSDAPKEPSAAGFVRHYLLALQFFTRIPVTGRLADWVGFSPAMLRASAAPLPRRGLAGGGGGGGGLRRKHRPASRLGVRTAAGGGAVHRGHGDADRRLPRRRLGRHRRRPGWQLRPQPCAGNHEGLARRRVWCAGAGAGRGHQARGAGAAGRQHPHRRRRHPRLRAGLAGPRAVRAARHCC